ncbi:hypothetical protein COO91_06552 [Nostoc flagelliforme CCNUN1]|uniref:Uncharacterized protein n=2 Tax=Nostoc flagelliforme TaxID=1306274 RepID=A0A2K8T0K0_9NOSO|nr:hypothetical protein COO91_06552 [Nostoc flagelliforme CCNUN1]
MKFVVCKLCQAKGVDSKDFAKNYIKNGKCYLPGKFEIIDGNRLKFFKYAFNHQYRDNLYKARRLWITDSFGACSYMLLNTCLEPTGMRFKETDMEKEYQFHFGGDRQFRLNSGRADIVVDGEVIELKRETIDCNAVGQLLRYLKSSGKLKGRLVAPAIHPDALYLILFINQLGFEIKYTKVIIQATKIV